MKNICDKNLCTGCTACYASCNKGAIVMNPDNEGFLYPEINQDLCTDCGLCQKVCPVNNYYSDNKKDPSAYAIMANDEIRKISSSGGAFTVLAEYILDNNGYVCAAGYDNEMNVCHQFIKNKNDLAKLRGSKYVQSNMNELFKKTQEVLKNNKLVLFVGTPCQVAGLKSFLKTEYGNLITADLICHGVPSPKVFKNYLQEEFKGQKVLNVNFRDKKDGWQTGYIITTATTVTGEIYSKRDYEDTYLTAFFANISLRKSCYNCNYTKLPRVGDFTFADCWGATPDIDDKKGTSTLFINNNKAQNVFEKIKDNFKLAKEISYEDQVK